MSMIKVTVGTNTSRNTVIVPETTTLREIFEENNIEYSNALVTLDGCNLQAGSMDMSLEELNIAESCFLIASIKQDNAR